MGTLMSMIELTFWRGVRVSPSIVPKLDRWVHGHGGFTVTSGYRSRWHNRRVGGARNSHHLRGTAVDLVGPSDLLGHLGATARGYGAVEVLRESDHLHVAF